MTELPHDFLAEKSFLSCLLLDTQSYDEVIDLGLRQENFYHPGYGQVFASMVELIDENQLIDYVTVCGRLREQGHLDKLGGEKFVLDISEEQASSANIYHYAKAVKDKAIRREVIREALRVVEVGNQGGQNTKDFLREVESRFFKLTLEAKSGQMMKLVNCLKQNLKDLEDDSRKPGEISGLPTGFKKLDHKLLGLQAGQMIVCAGRPGSGKTAFALNLAMNGCKATGLPIAIFSFEMLSSELSMRLLASESKVESQRLRTKNWLDTDMRNISRAVNTLSNLPIFINDGGNNTVSDIQSQCRKIKAEQGLGMIVVDYLQLVAPMNKAIPREQQISEMSRMFKVMAKELECPVIILSQLNRGVEARTDKRPMVSDLRESGSIEQDADVVLLIYRDDMYNPDSKEKGVAEIIVGKNRAGEQGAVKLSWVGPHFSFGNLAEFEESPQTQYPPSQP